MENNFRLLVNQNTSYTVLLHRMSKTKNQRHEITWSIFQLYHFVPDHQWDVRVGKSSDGFYVIGLEEQRRDDQSLSTTYKPIRIRLTQIRESLLQIQLIQGCDLRIWVTLFIYRLEFVSESLRSSLLKNLRELEIKKNLSSSTADLKWLPQVTMRHYKHSVNPL